jgi:hypothetical protein
MYLNFRTYLGDGKQPLYEPKLFIVPSSENVPRSILEEKEMENLAKNERKCWVTIMI